jgi:hypothetical protein
MNWIAELFRIALCLGFCFDLCIYDNSDIWKGFHKLSGGKLFLIIKECTPIWRPAKAKYIGLLIVKLHYSWLQAGGTATRNEHESKAPIQNYKNRTLQFCQASLSFAEVSLLWPSDVWTKKMCKPQQPKRLKWWLIDLNDEKRKRKKLG